ncbi:MAG TPA: hypothetical protein VFK57_12685 [Vicinamibacterales bacterium]|nr:hypothetical protein [Vicinamibacterales bacterium]
MRRKVAGVMLVAVLTTGTRIGNAQTGVPRVRPEDAAIRTLIDRGMERAATFRDLYTGLDTADVIVYVRFSRCHNGVPACLVWASAGTDTRRLLIKIDRFGRSPDELIALLAHELQHAHEVAAAPEITGVASFQKSFAARGWKHGDGFETEQAGNVGRRVAAELSRGAGDEPRRSGGAPAAKRRRK